MDSQTLTWPVFDLAGRSRKQLKENGAPRPIRTGDLQIRSLLLYPAELGAHRHGHGRNDILPEEPQRGSPAHDNTAAIATLTVR